MPIRQAGKVTGQKKFLLVEREWKRENETGDSQFAGSERAYSIGLWLCGVTITASVISIGSTSLLDQSEH